MGGTKLRWAALYSHSNDPNSLLKYPTLNSLSTIRYPSNHSTPNTWNASWNESSRYKYLTKPGMSPEVAGITTHYPIETLPY